MGSVCCKSVGRKRPDKREKQKPGGIPKRRVLKFLERAPKHFFTVNKLVQMIGPKQLRGVQSLRVSCALSLLQADFKVVCSSTLFSTNRVPRYGLLSHWVSLSKLEEFVLERLSDGSRMVSGRLVSAVECSDLYPAHTVDFSAWDFLTKLEGEGKITRAWDRCRPYHLTPGQFLDYESRKAQRVHANSDN